MNDQDRPRGSADLLALGFGSATLMWGIGYVGRLPVVLAPSWLVAIAMLAVPIAGGYCAGSQTTRGWRGGLWAGIIAGVLNLLVLGSFITGNEPNRVHPSAALFVPGSVILMGLLGAAGAAIGARRSAATRTAPLWTNAFVKVGIAATFLLLVAGGLVTSNAAGLAVTDWPNSERYAMFLYPLARMTGGIYYEHAHRLLGSLVGLTTLVIAIHLWSVDKRAWVKRLAFIAFVLVVIQGILGGLRVTGKFTLASDPALTEPNIYLAVAHGVLAQIFFATMAVLAAATSRTWLAATRPSPDPHAGADRTFAALLVVLLLVQLTLGAVQRHLAHGLLIHVTFAFVVASLAISCGARAWFCHPGKPALRRAGELLLGITGLQFALGLGAFAVVGELSEAAATDPWSLVIRTAHHGTGAVLLATAVVHAAWLRRLVVAERGAGLVGVEAR